MVKRKLNFKRVIIVIILFILLFICMGMGIFVYGLTPVNKSGELQSYQVLAGTTVNEVFEDLESKDLIRSALFMKLYSKIAGTISIEAGDYQIGPNMSSIDIFKALKGASSSNRETITFTFKEGRNVRDFVANLSEVISINSEEAMNKMSDEKYLKTLISQYWFLTDDILNEDIYYPLEGYLFPNTYSIYKDSSLEDVIIKMLDETSNQLEKYKSEIENSDYSVHELLTLASIVELESSNTSDRKDIAGVFKNRLDIDMPLESCVSTFYAFHINMGDRDLLLDEIYDCSTEYNTRCKDFIGLPVGPIGNSGIDSIEATLHPNEHDYYFFASDKDMNTYFSETLEEHEATVKRLQEEGSWLLYE